ncbi:MAG: divergent PAP2 family protein [Clostridiales bacterium]|nr:divergent PAP2 family protein [Clostridiales bacterium]
MGLVRGLLSNKAVLIPILAWFIAQSIKIFTHLVTEKKLDFTRIFGSGGMPSSHSAFTVSLAVVIGMNSGWDSPLFALSVAFALIVMYDAAGVRRAAGKQAKVLNKLVHTHYTKPEIEEKLKELLGHTPMEVFMGAILGIVIGIWLG